MGNPRGKGGRLLNLQKFLENRIISLGVLQDQQEFTDPILKQKVAKGNKGNDKTISSHLTQESKAKSLSKRCCLFCSGTNHNIFKCFKFNKLSFAKKGQFLNSNQMYHNCFSAKHTTAECSSDYCDKKHNSLLHVDKQMKLPVHEVSVESSSFV